MGPGRESLGANPDLFFFMRNRQNSAGELAHDYWRVGSNNVAQAFAELPFNVTRGVVPVQISAGHRGACVLLSNGEVKYGVCHSIPGACHLLWLPPRSVPSLSPPEMASQNTSVTLQATAADDGNG